MVLPGLSGPPRAEFYAAAASADEAESVSRAVGRGQEDRCARTQVERPQLLQRHLTELVQYVPEKNWHPFGPCPLQDVTNIVRGIELNDGCQCFQLLYLLLIFSPLKYYIKANSNRTYKIC